MSNRAVLARIAKGVRSRRGRRLLVAALLAPGLAWVALLSLAAWRARLVAPEPTLLVRDRAGRFLGELAAPGDERLGFWELPEVPDRVARATLALEDRRFRWHPGVDPLALARAMRQNLSSGRRVSGASTLAMQVARLQHPGARGFLRKAVEAATAVVLTARHGRRELLRHYLRIVPYGNRIHGIAYAARRYLDKPVEDLSWAEIAFLCAIPQSPARMNPYLPAGRARAVRRGRALLDRLAASGEISAREHEVALAEIETLALPWRAVRPAAALHPLLGLGRRVSAERRRARPLLDTTLDLELQGEAEWAAWSAVAGAAGRGAGNAAAIVVECDGWRVRAAVGSTGYFDAASAGAIDYLRLPRSSGSTLKPFLFAAALERGALTPATVLDDLGPGPGGIVNSDDRFLGPLLPRVALANSRNVPAALLAARLGPDPLYALLGDLGLHAHERPAARYGLGLAIGALPVTLERLVGAYTTLAGDGTLADLAWLDAEPPSPAPRRIFSEDTARLVTLFLADPNARLPTFPRMGATETAFPVAVKTGTSSRYRDAWTVAWSKRYLVGVWIGHPDERPMAQLSGYRVSARLARDLLERLHRGESGFEEAGFPPPRGWRAERLCALTGARATGACDRALVEWLPPASAPPPDCTAHRRVLADRRTGRLATATTAPEDLDDRVYVELPARYAGWLRRQGLESLPEALAATARAERERARALAGVVPEVAILAPEAGLRLLFDPEAPAELNTLALTAVAEPAPRQLVWFVDGRPWRTVEPPFSARWPLARGEHTFQARVPFSSARSPLVRVLVD